MQQFHSFMLNFNIKFEYFLTKCLHKNLRLKKNYESLKLRY
jgi:hypothetical protein